MPAIRLTNTAEQYIIATGRNKMSCFTTLKDKGLRLTRPRRIILDFIHDKGEHLTAEEIIRYVHGTDPHINKSTIYRTLELLEKNECVYKSESAGGTVYHHAEEGHHHHLVCTKCGKTLSCEEDVFAPVERALQKKYGFKADLRHLMLGGICGECKAREN